MCVLLEEKMTMVGIMHGGMIEDVATIGGLIGVQFVFAGNAVLLSYLMSLGLNSLTIVVFTSIATFLILTPVAFFYERCFSFSITLCPSKLTFFFKKKLFLGFSVLFWDCMEINFMVVCNCCRSIWPRKFSFKLLVRFLLLSFGG